MLSHTRSEGPGTAGMPWLRLDNRRAKKFRDFHKLDRERYRPKFRGWQLPSFVRGRLERRRFVGTRVDQFSSYLVCMRVRRNLRRLGC